MTTNAIGQKPYPLQLQIRPVPDHLVGMSEILKKRGCIYLENISPEIDWLKLVQLLTGCPPILQENGEYIYPVKASKEKASLSHSQSQNAVQPHTDGSYSRPPHYLAIKGVNAARCGGGLTQLFDVREFLRCKLTEMEIKHLMLTKYRFSSNDGSEQTFSSVVEFPKPTELRFRFSYNNLVFGESSPDLSKILKPQDSLIQDIANRLLEDFAANHFAVRVKKNGLLIFDNWIFCHARTAYKDTSRHLLRAWFG